MNAIVQAKELMTRGPVFLDTETTGLGNSDQVVEIAIIDISGELLIESLVKPTIPIPRDATIIHGITELMVKDAPFFLDVINDIMKIIADKPLLIYNADFDIRMLRQSASAHQLDINFQKDVHCVMKMYAEFHGDWNDYRQSYRWQSLGAAAKQCRLNLPLRLHRARADTELTRQVFIHMANQ